MVERSILIGSLSGPYFATQTAKMNHSQTDFTDLCSQKGVQGGLIRATDTHFKAFFTNFLNLHIFAGCPKDFWPGL